MAFTKKFNLSNVEDEPYIAPHNQDEGEYDEKKISPDDIVDDITENLSLEKAIDIYKKIRENKDDITEKEQEEIERECEKIRNRDIIDVDEIHNPEEIGSDGKIITGPPRLTRFESARIMGARALQLSLGAPPFISIPKGASTSLDIAIKELEERVIPITIRRTLPNGDYQNIPITNFK